jgi:Ca2+-binding EF-hand superfamily protein
MAQNMFKDLDTDGDGSISKGELQKASEAASNATSTSDSGSTSRSTSSLDDLFSALDTDANGSVSESELSSYLDKAGPPQGPPPRIDNTSDSSSSTSSTSTSSDTASQALTDEQRMAFAYKQLMSALQMFNDSSSSSGDSSIRIAS